MNEEEAMKLKEALEYFNKINWVGLVNSYYELQQQNEFLRQRENKLQMIEQMFKNGSVDLGDLAALVEEK